MKKYKGLILAILIVLVIAAIVSQFASGEPDGLERAAQDLGFAEQSKTVVSSPFADYLFPGIKNEKLASGLAGGLGAILVFVTILALGKFIGRNKPQNGENKKGGVSNV